MNSSFKLSLDKYSGFYLIQNLLNDGNITKIIVENRDIKVKMERRANHNHSSRKILSLIMFKLRTHMA